MTEQEIKALLQQADDLYLKGQLDKAIEILRRIKREDSPKLYAKAQLNLGVVLGAQGDTEGAIAACRNITREDSPERYAKAQFNLGVVLGEQGDTEGAIAAYRNITREDSSETYAKAQFNLGVILGEQGDTEGAIAAYRSIKREDSPETYVMAQVNLGAALGKQGDTEGAIAACRNVTREDSREQYAKAQVNLGVALAKQGKTDEAIDTFRNIQPEDSKESYAKAQFGLSILEARGDTEGAIAVYRNITREDSRELYAKAKFNLGVTLEAQGDTEGAIAAYRKITRKDSSELYAMAQFNLGVALQEQGKIEEAKQAFSNSRSVFYYQAESQLKILNCPPDSRSNLAAVYDAIESIIQTLFISSYGGIAGENPLKVAHYTRPSTAGKLIAGDSAKASPLRLSTVKGTNDPTEGKILYGYLHKSCGLLSGVLDVEQESDSQALAAFISCFTFNHDSLNQFRLYGKEDGLEASGVSLVFEKHFFSAADPFAIMTAASEREAIMTANNTIEDSRPERADKTTQEKLDKLPLYRCIYLDPQSGYVSIAHRDKVTFYAEAWYGKKTAAHQDICKEAEKRWKKYQNEINELAKKAKKDLSTLSKKIKAVAKDAENDVLQTLVFILQPLRYLVKHAAFQEEQECRMVYIIGDLLKDERIRTDWGAKQMYLEYAEPVRKSLDKIYLSPGAEPYADFFKRELPHLAKKGGIRRSQNPFRNK